LVAITGGRRGVRIAFPAGEASGFEAVLGLYVELLETGSPTDPVLQRLYPAAYADAEQAAEFRELTSASLRDERIERINACRAELTTDVYTAVTVRPDRAAMTRWIQVLNDLRLAFGTRLGVTEDDSFSVDLDAPDVRERVFYGLLGAMQEDLVQELMR
jgi:hypothetical protein